jgi:hypothetical protein
VTRALRIFNDKQLEKEKKKLLVKVFKGMGYKDSQVNNYFQKLH